MVPLRCSCGAFLPEDARFCYKCGRPQYEEDIARLNEEQTTPVPETPVPLGVILQPPIRIGLGNGRAIRVTLGVAALSFLVLSIFASLAPPLIVPVLFATGFASARLYQTRSLEKITATGGAALGIMTWLWLFLVEAIGSAFCVFTDQGREMIKVAASSRPELANLVSDPQKLLMMMGGALILFVFIGTISSAFGGVVAARMQPRNSASH